MLDAYGEPPVLAPYGLAVLRVALAIVFIGHGGQKLFGIWGGHGLEMTAGFFAQMNLHPAMPLALAVSVVEFAGGLLLLFGAFTFVTSLLLTLDMVIAIIKVHLSAGFFLNWDLVVGREHGFEYNLTLIAGLICLMLAGPGAFSFDAYRASHARAAAAGRARLRAGRV